MTMQQKTREDLEALKANWLKDPCWDIEDTEGFADYYDELVAFRKEEDRKIDEAYAALQAQLTIKTIRTRIFENYDKTATAGDLEISDLRREGWTVENIAFVTYTDNGGDFPVQVIERLVTLTHSAVHG